MVLDLGFEVICRVYEEASFATSLSMSVARSKDRCGSNSGEQRATSAVDSEAYALRVGFIGVVEGGLCAVIECLAVS